MFRRPAPTVTTAIDIGTTKVCTILGRQGKDEEVEVLGVGVVPSQGLLLDTVVSIDELSEALAASAREASRAAGANLTAAYVGVTGAYFETVPRAGSLWKPDGAPPVSTLDLDQTLEAARPSPVPHGNELVHLVAREYLLDGTRGIRNPVGMHALHLEVNALAVLGRSAPLENLRKAASRAGVSIQRLVFQPLSVGEAILSQEERHLGALVVDIGGGGTYLASFWRGVFWDSRTIPIGGYHLTNDIAVVLGAPSYGAEEAKRAWGTVQPWKVLPDETVQLPGFEEDTSQEVSRKDLSMVIHDRTAELFELIHENMKEMGLDRLPAAGAVLTGGTANLPGLKELAHDLLGSPVRIGTPETLKGGEALEDPTFASSVGTLLWALRRSTPRQHHKNGRPKVAASPQKVPQLPLVGK